MTTTRNHRTQHEIVIRNWDANVAPPESDVYPDPFDLLVKFDAWEDSFYAGDILSVREYRGVSIEITEVISNSAVKLNDAETGEFRELLPLGTRAECIPGWKPSFHDKLTLTIFRSLKQNARTGLR